ncbi:RNA polymerase sigma factor [Corallococcus sp. Z5C101001]|uniref:RNA polymerase sigma factor n=1 Tax=Corallococcus sp. Z5C101001 TaxID=2596829 RepID=UPI00163D8DFF|nr:RNA polymerase sigma factor [Corallococcus sp. Z5C101001]
MNTVGSGQWASEFARKNRAWLLARAEGLCRNRSDAEDLVQEALLRFIKRYDGVEAPPDPKLPSAWLIKTMTNLFYDQCRRRKVRSQREKDPILTESNRVEPEPEAGLLSDDITLEQLSEALGQLNPTMRATFEQHVQGKKYRDIARFFGVPVGTVSKRLHDIRSKLRSFLSTGVN